MLINLLKRKTLCLKGYEEIVFQWKIRKKKRKNWKSTEAENGNMNRSQRRTRTQRSREGENDLQNHPTKRKAIPFWARKVDFQLPHSLILFQRIWVASTRNLSAENEAKKNIGINSRAADLLDRQPRKCRCCCWEHTKIAEPCRYIAQCDRKGFRDATRPSGIHWAISKQEITFSFY